MPVPVIYAAIVAAFEVAFVQAVAAVVRAFVWSLITAVTATMIQIIRDAALQWLEANGPEIIAKCIEAELEIDLQGNYTPEGFTDAVNRKYGTEFTNLFDKDAVRADAEAFAVKKINEVLGQEVLTSLDPESLQVELPEGLARLLAEAIEGELSGLFDLQVIEDLVLDVASKVPDGFGPNAPIEPSPQLADARARWDAWRASKQGYKWVRAR